MRRFIILFDEKEGTSALVRLLDNFPQVSIVHQAGGGGWEPFDRHNCGLMSLANLERCLDHIVGTAPVDLVKLNRIYMKTAARPLEFDPIAATIGFKMRFAPPRRYPGGMASLMQRTPLAAAFARRTRDAFEHVMMALFARHSVTVFVVVRQDTLRWGLSKYHGDGSGRPGHIQFKIAQGEISREALGRIEVDIDRLATIIRQCDDAHAAKRQLLEKLKRQGVRSYALFYEDFVADKIAYLRRFFALIDAPISVDDLQSALNEGVYFEKVHPDDIAQFVVNHAEVLARFGGRMASWDRARYGG